MGWFTIHVHHHQSDAVSRGEVAIWKELKKIMATLEELKGAVEANSAVIDSAVLLIGGLADKIEELKDNPEQLAELAGELRGSTAALAAAVAANTSPEPAPEPAPGE